MSLVFAGIVQPMALAPFEAEAPRDFLSERFAGFKIPRYV